MAGLKLILIQAEIGHSGHRKEQGLTVFLAEPLELVEEVIVDL